MLPVQRETILTVANLRKRFRGIEVLNDVSLSVSSGQVTALIGSNGAGKSTLLNLLSGLIAADGGTIHLGGHDITRLAPYARARLGLGRTFQHPRSFRSLSVLESVEFAATPVADEGVLRGLGSALRKASPARAAMRERALHWLRLCALEARADVAARELSYGEQKLLMLAQVLASGGRLMCFDELCAGLEPALIEQVKTSFRALVAEGKSVLFIEHNLQLVRDMADWVVFLHQGTIFRQGETRVVLEDPEVVRLYLGH
jgi:ABC-type branched-subunit amino acid transport system ATPase component